MKLYNHKYNSWNAFITYIPAFQRHKLSSCSPETLSSMRMSKARRHGAITVSYLTTLNCTFVHHQLGEVRWWGWAWYYSRIRKVQKWILLHFKEEINCKRLVTDNLDRIKKKENTSAVTKFV